MANDSSTDSSDSTTDVDSDSGSSDQSETLDELEGETWDEHTPDEETGDGSSEEDVKSVGDDADSDEVTTVGEFVSQVSDQLDVDVTSLDECLSEIESLKAERDELAQEANDKEDYVEDLEAKLKQEREEFKQFRANREDRLEEDRKQQVKDLFTDLSEVHAELHRALSQEHDDVESLREGVEMVFDGLEEVFADEDVVCVKPHPGDEVDPRLHNIVTTRESEQESDTVAEVYKPGYEFDGMVLDPAQVVVSE